MGEIPGANVVIKMPIDVNQFSEIINESQFLMALSNTEFKDFIVQVLEEILIVDEKTGSVIFYCTIVERAANTLDSFKIIDGLQSRYLAFIYLYFMMNSMEILQKLEKNHIYYGDFKEENILVDFHSMDLRLLDFGTAFIMNEKENYLKVITPSYAHEEAKIAFEQQEPLTKK